MGKDKIFGWSAHLVSFAVFNLCIRTSHRWTHLLSELCTGGHIFIASFVAELCTSEHIFVESFAQVGTFA